MYWKDNIHNKHQHAIHRACGYHNNFLLPLRHPVLYIWHLNVLKFFLYQQKCLSIWAWNSLYLKVIVWSSHFSFEPLHHFKQCMFFVQQIKNHFSIAFIVYKSVKNVKLLERIGIARPEEEFHVPLDSYR